MEVHDPSLQEHSIFILENKFLLVFKNSNSTACYLR